MIAIKIYISYKNMSEERKKRGSTNLFPASKSQKKKKLKIEKNPHLIFANHETKLFNITIVTSSVPENSSGDLPKPKQYDPPMSEKIPRLPAEVNLAAPSITEVFIITKNNARRHTFGKYDSKQNTDQVTLIIFSKLPNHHILRKFKRAKYNKSPPKVSDVRANLNCGFLRFIKKIINGWPKLLTKPFEKIDNEMHQSDLFEKLEKFFQDHKEILKLFDPFILSLKKPKTKPQDESNKDYNDYINIVQLLDYFVDSIIREAFYLYVDYLLYGATSDNLQERVNFCPRDPNTLDIEELGHFLKHMCKKVCYVQSTIDMTEENVLTFIKGGVANMPFASNQIENHDVFIGFENRPFALDHFEIHDAGFQFEGMLSALDQIKIDDPHFEFEINGENSKREPELKILDNSEKTTQDFTKEKSESSPQDSNFCEIDTDIESFLWFS